MTYIVKDECIKCKLTDCVEVCPVDCFYEGENMLVINPDECIDCGVCEPECPIDAIKADTDDSVKDMERWLFFYFFDFWFFIRSWSTIFFVSGFYCRLGLIKLF